MSKNYALIVAGGKGKRVGRDISKQFICINNKPIIWYTIKAFESCEHIDGIVVVISKDDMDYFNENVLEVYDFKKILAVVEGGAERQDSVYNGLLMMKDCDIVLIHDGARPFVSEKIINEGIEYAKSYGAAACGVMPKDTIKVKDSDDFSKETLQRDTLFAVQTPQCFEYNSIKKAHEFIRKENLMVTDDTMVIEKLGKRVYLYEGSYTNIKVTTPEDIEVAEIISKGIVDNNHQ
ncbi:MULTISPECIES: 2-C-methyl-D-erythritol 4-phosphate cytidylyltransferase [Clostridium]|uniref:2-C-methyl-D-erythritol 4-phosphate cytidylyltransferase n=1 Tax=Clostridium cadaveris TaxID=1529 RepID=A0A1I2PXE3_9CLOT|nr:2-C-methyl-D-erythritol 4-phosphate cytidylyltransferase [Clostridium cadaveris]MDU4953497.1 2-C-methyl-D-erythritol 4-phosphate cytidylyltransferase [Clostridium sp.]MDM8311204.1 2-C-methyl-D-erythritol 4-phosphate cytidylyltransferase [Clostridium cadaveris]MDY4948015.1 2-C-methyl-D-erythritol 4-phosphate cytidylyltransferase [Clostridium cadaveris]NME66095.1 2-C-methyl-D-erythritol 4-phosphate cytidylyltransferase [Clostridium cadaveris]NWK12660.1 2-C-methyl-D-erythritol 4-phosphate cyti